jgi:hypothetical protein
MKYNPILLLDRIPNETQLTGVVETFPPFFQYKVLPQSRRKKQLPWQPYVKTIFPPDRPLPALIAQRFQSQSIGPEMEVIFKNQYWKEHPKH